jgi:hypothetical protein
LKGRACDSENFGSRITKFEVAVEKIWTKEVRRAKIGIWKTLGGFFGNLQGLWWNGFVIWNKMKG